jgi:hypothetical protein
MPESTDNDTQKRKSPISNRREVFAIIDQADSDLAQDMFHESNGYAINSSGRSLHREVIERMIKRPLLRGEQVDHINHKKLDNRRCNLRLATPSQQQANKGKSSRNKSGYIGVSRSGKLWRADLKFAGTHLYLGRYPTAALAAFVRDEEARKHPEWFHELNFPQSIRLRGLFERELIDFALTGDLSSSCLNFVRTILSA